MKRNKLLRISGFSVLFFLASVLNLYAQYSCDNATEAMIGINTKIPEPHWFSYQVPDDMETLELSSIGHTTKDTRVYVYSRCGGGYIAYSRNANGTTQSKVTLNVKNYQGETLYFKWDVYGGSGAFDWNLTGKDNQDREYKNDISIEDFSVWYGEKKVPSNNYISRYPVKYSIAGKNNGVIRIDGETIEGLGATGSQEVLAVMQDENDEIIAQQTFMVTILLDNSGKKKSFLYDFPESYAGELGDSITIEGTTNSNASILYSLVNAGDKVKLVGNVLVFNRDAVIDGNEEIKLKVNVLESGSYTSTSTEIIVDVKPYFNGIPAQQYKALEAIYKKNNGENWTNQSNWLTDAPVNDWYGIATESRIDEKGYTYYTVTVIDFSYNQFNSVIAEEIQYLTDLKTLDLQYAYIEGFPSSISQLLNLERLIIRSNALISYDIISTLTSLNYVRLDYCEFKEFPQALYSLPNLTYLNLNNNPLVSIPSEIGNFTNLEYLFLDRTEINSLPSELANCSSLRSLYIGNNKFTTIPESVYNIPNLSYLYIRSNSLSFDDLIAFRSISSASIDYRYQEEYDLLMSQNIVEGTTTLSNTDVSDGNTYTWYRNGSVISGATSSSYTYSYADNIGARYKCRITNSNWPNLTLYSNELTEKGELVTLVVNNIPDNTPENNEIYTVGGLTNNDSTSRSYPLVLNPTTKQYELRLPKSLGSFNYFFTLRKYREFSEVNASGEYVVRSVDLSTMSGRNTIEDIMAWKTSPAASPNYSCAESKETQLGKVHYVENTSMWYHFTADRRMNLKIKVFDSNGSRLKVYDACGGEGIYTSYSSSSSHTRTLKLDKGQVIYFSLEDYYSNKNEAIKFELQANYLKTYVLRSVPENTPEGVEISAYGKLNNNYYNQRFTLNDTEESGVYELVLSESYNEYNFNFELNELNLFFEVDADGESVTRTINPATDDDYTELSPVIAWDSIPPVENTCETAIEITEDGTYIKGLKEQWYTYTAVEDVELIFSAPYVYHRFYIYDECGGQSVASASRYNGLTYQLDQGETLLLKVDNYYSNEKSFEWTLKSRVLKTLIVENVPRTLPWTSEIYAVGDMDHFLSYNDQLEYNEEEDHYEITFYEDLDTVNFSFVIAYTDSLREVNAKGETFVRTIDLVNTPNNTKIADISSWKGVDSGYTFYKANSCEEAYEVSEGIFINDNKDVWYKLKTDEDVIVKLNSKDVSNRKTRVRVYDQCGGNRMYYDYFDTDIDFRLNAKDSVLINWDIYYSNEVVGFLWSLDTVRVKDQTLNNLISNLVVPGTYELDDKTRFRTDQDRAFHVELEEGNAELTADNKMIIHSTGDIRLHLTNVGDNYYYYDLDTVITLSINHPYQSVHQREFIRDITTTGRYIIPEDYGTDQNVLSTIEALTQNVVITDDTLQVTEAGDVTLRVYNNGDHNYFAFDTTVTFEVEKLDIASYETDFFSSLVYKGNYTMPEFITERGIVLTPRFISGNGKIEEDTLRLYGEGSFEVELSAEATVINEAFSTRIPFVLQKYQTINQEGFISGISTIGEYTTPANYSTDQGLPLSVQAVGGNVIVRGNNLSIYNAGEVQLRLFNEATDNYFAFDSIVTFNTERLTLASYETTFFDSVTAIASYQMPEFVTNEGVRLTASLVSGDGEILGNRLTINSLGNFEVLLSSGITSKYKAYSTSITFSVAEKATQTILKDGLISEISTTGEYIIPADYSSDQGLALNVEAVSANASIHNDTLTINASGETKLRVYNEGDSIYAALDTTVTLDVKKSPLATYSTDFFNTVKKAGTYTLPEFVTAENVVLTPSMNSADAVIDGNTLIVHKVGYYEVFFTSEATPMYEAYSGTISFMVINKTAQSLAKEEFISMITATGVYEIPENYTTDQGIPMKIKGISQGIQSTDTTLTINAPGELLIRAYNTGSNTYSAFDSVFTIEVDKMLIAGYKTDFFDNITETGAYFLPNFITDENVELTVSMVSGDGVIEGDSLKLNTIGTYEVTLSSEATSMYEAFSMSITFTVDKEGNVTDPTTSLESELSKEMKLFPNPAKGNVTLRVPAIEGEMELVVVSSSGQVLKVENITGLQQYKIDISNLNTGVYILKVNTESGIGIQRLIVQ
ncbi:T9SS type A sorting domain-containing protein [Flammeovirga aprica]|uniref:T9SS type A sorting domain-containing protein n=1 Tax=Flammeovirga aprica JL-4 TaxID=694437 RepID=A0A7X9RYC8_9BACT|nr:T9SS type A sorting domain-containing protein [Flammeovirga aprica]NME70986.1 T9SS type A sorting domain-containing protein [Flammeovirga aprica JL-4]